ncbi:MFS transporter [Kitasatospora gansuensis]
MLSVSAVLPVVYGIKQLAVEGWDLTAALAIVGGLVLVGLLVLRLRTAATPLVDLALFRNPIFTGAISVNTIAMLAMMGFSLFTSQYLQLVRGYSPLTASLWALLPSVGVGAAVGISGALAGKIRPGVQMAGGMLVGALGFGILTQVQVDSPLALILVGAGVLAAGSVSTVMQTAELVVSAAPADQAGAASATSETASELGGSLGIAVLGAAGAAVYTARLDGKLPAALPDGALTVAQDTLGGAVTVAAELPIDVAEQLLGAARIAFTDGLHLAAAVGVLCLLAGSAVAYRLLGSLPADRAEEIPEEQLTEAPSRPRPPDRARPVGPPDPTRPLGHESPWGLVAKLISMPEPSQPEEPDYRFSLANERTFLAWIRTALALLAGAIALDQLAPGLAPHPSGRRSGWCWRSGRPGWARPRTGGGPGWTGRCGPTNRCRAPTSCWC